MYVEIDQTSSPCVLFLAVLLPEILTLKSSSSFRASTIDIRNVCQKFNKTYQTSSGHDIRQPAVAGAIQIFRLFYAKHSYIDAIDPLLVCGAAILLACKVYEIPLSAKRVTCLLGECTRAESKRCKYTPVDYYDAEAFLFASVVAEYDLFLHQPFEAFYNMAHDLLAFKESDRRSVQLVVDDAFVLLNDSWCTSLFMSYPPYQIALCCFFTASFIQGEPAPSSGSTSGVATAKPLNAPADSSGGNPLVGKKVVWDWLKEIDVDLSVMERISQELLSVFSLFQELKSDVFVDQINATIDRIWDRERELAAKGKRVLTTGAMLSAQAAANASSSTGPMSNTGGNNSAPLSGSQGHTSAR